MVEVPVAAMLSIDSIPSDFINMFNGISTHGLLAAFLTHADPGTLEKYDLWKATWPTLPDFEEGMPILWPKNLGGLELKTPVPTAATTDLSSISLPPSISGLWNTFRKIQLTEEYETKHQNLLSQQEARLRDAWRDVVAVFPNTDWETFLYHWLIINTRSFYYLMPGEEPPEDSNDAMALVPFADYFNHTDGAVSFSFITFRRQYAYCSWIRNARSILMERVIHFERRGYIVTHLSYIQLS